MKASLCLHNATVLTGFAAMENCAVLIEDGLVSDVFSERRFKQKVFKDGVTIIDAGGAYLSAGFIDTHIHGLGGYGTEDGTVEAVLGMSRELVKHGVTAFHPTLYPQEPERLKQTLRAMHAAMGQEEGAAILGLHLEGPFISPAMAGVQLPQTLSLPDIALMEQLYDASGGAISNMTVAPELKGMREICLYCVRKGIVLQAGHTDARYENMVEGMQGGILHSTHLFNAMSRLDHRNPNAVGAILTHPEISCEIIADGYHVHPDLFKLLLRNKSSDRIVLVTDALKPTGLNFLAGGSLPPRSEAALDDASSTLPPSLGAAAPKTPPLYANGEEVEYRDGVWHRKKDGVIAGSALTMIRGVQNLVRFGFSLEDAVKAASFNPANTMKHAGRGAVIPGYIADIVVFDSEFNIKYTIVGGEMKYESAH